MNLDIEYKDITLNIKFDHQPYEPEVRYYPDGTGYPGCPEEVWINQVYHKGEDIIELLDDQLGEIEELILNKLHED